jgi:CheY-like chemotaxis protein
MNRQFFLEPEVLERISRLPLPPVAVRILAAARDQRAPIQSLADAITADGMLAPRLLHLANYAPGPSRRFTDVIDATNVLGVDNIKSLALGLASYSFETAQRGEEDDEGDRPISWLKLWEHSLGTAIVAGRLAERAGLEFCQQVFTAGFLHDIGRVLLYRHWRDSFFEALAMAREKNIPQAEAETLALGRNHLEIGELWAHTNDLAPLVRAAIGNHHLSFAMLGDLDEDSSRCIAAVQLADLLWENHEAGRGCNNVPGGKELWHKLGLAPEDWPEEMNYAEREIENSRELFGFPAREKKNFARVHAMAAREMAPAIAVPMDGGHSKAGGGRVIPFPVPGPNGADTANKIQNQKLTILIVEDHGSLCDMLSLYFKRYGYHVRTASDGETALMILENEEVHLVLLDLMLPRIDGFDVLRQIRKGPESKQPYVIVVSAGASAKDRSRVLEMGANEYMPKPFHLMRLLERIQNVEKYLLSPS